MGIFHWNHAEHAIIWALNNLNWSLIWRWWNNIFQKAVNCFFVHLKGLKFWIYSPWPSNFFSEINLFALLLKDNEFICFFLPKQNEFICFIKKITGYLQRKLQKSTKYLDLPCENILSFSWVKFMHWLKSVNGKRTKTSRKQVHWVRKQNRSNKLKS